MTLSLETTPRLLFVTGKGGVGKSTLASAIGLLSAAGGNRTLVCDLDAAGGIADALQLRKLRFGPTNVVGNLDAMAMETEAALREYLKLQLRFPVVPPLGPMARSLDFVATAAPGVREILTVGKVCHEVRVANYDTVVVDGPATGHIVGQLAAPRGIRELVSVGLIRGHTEWMLDMLNDPTTTGIVIVTLAEEMPIVETLELAERLAAETDVDLAAVIVNRVLPELFARSEEHLYDRIRSQACVSAMADELSGSVDSLIEATDLLIELRRDRTDHLGTLRQNLPAGVPLLYVPELFARASGLRATRQLADALAAELE